MSDWELFNEIIRRGVAEVKFIKRDGSERVMKATLLRKYYPDYQFKKGTVDPSEKRDDPQPVWDIEKGAWRSIRKDSIVSVREIEDELQ